MMFFKHLASRALQRGLRPFRAQTAYAVFQNSPFHTLKVPVPPC